MNWYHDDDEYRLKMMMNEVVNVNEMLFQVVVVQSELTVVIEYLLKLNDHVHHDPDLEKKSFFIKKNV